MSLRVNVCVAVFHVLALLAFESSVYASSANPILYMDRGFVHAVDDLGVDPGGLRRVRVSREDGRTFEAAVGDGTIVQLREGADLNAALLRFRLRGEQISAGARLYLVRSATLEHDGISLAVRLSLDDAREYFSMSVPDYHLAKKPAAIDVPPNDPRYNGQWFLQRLNIEGAWAYSTGSATVSIAVVDGGCDLVHPDLINKFDPGRDEVDGDDDPTYRADDVGPEHGTACAGLIAAETNNSLGVAGACPECRLRCIRLIDNPAPLSADVRSFEFAKNNGVSVVSNSWGYVEHIPAPGPIAAAIADITENGRNGLGSVVVFASGNENRELLSDEIAALPNVISVGALTIFDETTSFSNFGAALDVVSPIGSLTTDISGSIGQDPSDYTNNFGGTSSACPLVSGIAALLISAKPDAHAREIEAAIIETTRPAPFATPGPDGHDPHYGFGIVDATRAMRRILGIPDPVVDAGIPADSGEVEAPDAGVPADTGLSNSDMETSEEPGCSCSAQTARSDVWLSVLFLFSFAVIRSLRR